MKISYLSMPLIAAALVSAPASAAAPRYRLVKLPSPAGQVSSAARAISANGNITGEGGVSVGAGGNTPISYGNASALSPAFTGAPAGTTNAFTRGINDSGIAAGSAQDAVAGTSRAILTGTSGVSVLAPVTGFANAGAAGINNGGIAVGYSMSIGIFAAEGTARPINAGQGVQTATVWDAAGNATALANPFGAFNGLATAVNASGQVVGAANRSNAALSNATIWNGGVATALGTATTERSTARAISSTGWVAGRKDQLAGGSFQGSVWAAGGSEFNLAPTAGCAVSDLRGINASNNAVGFSQQGSCGNTGSFWQWNGTGYDAFEINSLVINLGGWDLFAPQAINDRGQIVGFGFDEFGVNQGFLLQAVVPEPASWLMMIAGFGLVGSAARRRRPVAAG